MPAQTFDFKTSSTKIADRFDIKAGEAKAFHKEIGSLKSELKRVGRRELLPLVEEIEQCYANDDDSRGKKLLRKLHSIVLPNKQFERKSHAAQLEVIQRARTSKQSFVGYASEDEPTLAKFLEKETLSAEELGKLVGVRRQTIDNRRQAGELLALKTFKRGFAYPKWQQEQKLWAPMSEVLRLLREKDPWDVNSFLLGEYPRLGGESPLALLRKGEQQKVMEFAKEYFALED